MSTLQYILTTAPPTVDQAWFASLASTLLHHTSLVIASQPHRLLEIEFYFFGGDHEDPFAHCDPFQKTSGLWYFHREGGEYRGGSFKGVDISFGPEGMFGGILIRTIQAPSGDVVNGCSLCVDHILSQTGHPNLSSLDREIALRSVWDESSPMFLQHSEDANDAGPIWATARVGLTLKRLYQHPTMPAFVMREYRFLTEPTISKGKIHTVMSMLKQGMSHEQICALTRSPLRSIQRYEEGYQDGLTLDSFNSFRGKALKVDDLCLLHGAWQNAYGA